MSYDFNRDMRQWADIEGEFHPDRQWLLSSTDTWHENPHYKGEPQPHPEDEVGENNQEPDVINCSEGALIALKNNIKHMIDEQFKKFGIENLWKTKTYHKWD